jgi:hypothetical protein
LCAAAEAAAHKRLVMMFLPLGALESSGGAPGRQPTTRPR